MIGFTCLIYSSLGWFIFAPLVLMAFELHSQIFPTLILNPPLQPLKSPYDLCYASDPSGGEWEDIKAYGRSFPLEWIWAKHIPFKHVRVECLFPWGSTYLVYSIFKWKCLLIVSCLRMLVHDMLWVLKRLVVLCWCWCNLGVFGKVNLSFAQGRAKVKCGGG